MAKFLCDYKIKGATVNSTLHELSALLLDQEIVSAETEYKAVTKVIAAPAI